MTWAIDLGLVAAAVAAVVTENVVMWFHIIFVLVVIAALELPFRPFAIRLAVWSLVSSGLVIWAVADLDVPRDEITELPILTFVLVLVFLVAQSRARSLDALRRAQRTAEAQTMVERETMRAQLEQSQRLDVLGRASTKTAHEMRSVLTIVRGCAAELGEEASPSVRAKGDELIGAVDRGLEMLDELLAAGRANHGPTGSIDPGKTLAETEALLGYLLHDGIDMTTALPDRPLTVHLDRTSFLQVVMNLVANAVDALGDDGGSIEVAVREVHRHRAGGGDAERLAVIAVADSGPGLNVPETTDVFEPGFSTKGEHHNGLGLTMVRQIANRSGGTVEIDSIPGKGTKVSVLLPLSTLSDQRSAPSVEASDASSTG